MIFKPKSLTNTEGSFILPSSAIACAHSCINKDILKEYWYNFSFQTSTLTVSECDEYVFSIGAVEKLPLDGHEYSVNVTADGVCVFAENEQALIRGFMMLLVILFSTTQSAAAKLFNRHSTQSAVFNALKAISAFVFYF